MTKISATISNKNGSRVFLLCLILCMAVVVPAMGQTEKYLDEMSDSLVCKQGWGALGLMTAAFAPGGPAPQHLKITEKEYNRGLGHHAPGEIAIRLDGKYLMFKAEVGVQWQGGNRGSVAFQVFVDGKNRFDSGRMTDSDSAKTVEVALAGARELRLVVADCGDGVSCDMANWAEARLIRDPKVPDVGQAAFVLDDPSVDAPMVMEGSYALFGTTKGNQVAFSKPLGMRTLVVRDDRELIVSVPIKDIRGPFSIKAEFKWVGGSNAEVSMRLSSGAVSRATLGSNSPSELTLSADGSQSSETLTVGVSAKQGEAVLSLKGIQYRSGNCVIAVDLPPLPLLSATPPTPRVIDPCRLLEEEFIEWDWRMQDGIGAGQVQGTFESAVERTLKSGAALVADLQEMGLKELGETAGWFAFTKELESLRAEKTVPDDPRWEDLWRKVHQVRRKLVFKNPLAKTGPLLFVKQAPAVFSHQLTQYYGRYARPGGGIYVLEQPGESMNIRQLAAGEFPQGSFMHPEVTHDGKRLIVSFCAVDKPPQDTFKGEQGHYYHLYDMAVDGSETRQLTDGAFDDFSPKELPNGKIVFISTRRGGWHRCGTPGCEVYTLTLMNPDGGEIRTISYHETQEWDPAVLNDGRLIYTRWDYVDRNAVFYEQLWSTRPDGTAPASFYGNNTFNPVGIWEPRPVPGSQRVMATAAPHHGMTAGSIILVDPTKGIDGPEALTRLTPDAPFPESESLLLPTWRAALGPEPSTRTPEMDRWPGQCYRSPYPLSEKYFLAAYSYDPLIGEPKGNAANIFGLYLVDAFGNKELLYRDLNIASAWPVPLHPREKAPNLPSIPGVDSNKEGTYFIQNIYDSNPGLGSDSIKRLRVVQVLPKSTSGANNPTVGAANASPGKQVLGTVPVEQDGSVYFRAPAGIALSFQALDELGQAVQVMRSVSYLQPGENASCVGCHESRLSAPATKASMPLAAKRSPSVIEPGPDGSNPLSYPILVQPILDKFCVRCHCGEKSAGPEGKSIVLTGEPAGRYTTSYNTLVERVSFSAWGRGNFPEGNSEPLAKPGFFGAKGSGLMKMLLAGHHDVQLKPEDIDRFTTWIDANALFYGTFNPLDQERQQRGERISGPDLQ